MPYFQSRQPGKLKLYKIKRVLNGYPGMWGVYHVSQVNGKCAKGPFMADVDLPRLWRMLATFHEYWKLYLIRRK